jgi:hypothetical protein
VQESKGFLVYTSNSSCQKPPFLILLSDDETKLKKMRDNLIIVHRYQ